MGGGGGSVVSMRLLSLSRMFGLVSTRPYASYAGRILHKVCRTLEPALYMFTLRRRPLADVALPLWGADSRLLLAFGHTSGKFNR